MFEMNFFDRQREDNFEYEFACGEGGYLAFGSSSGEVVVENKRHEVFSSRLLGLKYGNFHRDAGFSPKLPEKALRAFVCVGNDRDDRLKYKIFSSSFQLLFEANVAGGHNTSDSCFFAVNETLTALAVGFQKRNSYLIFGDLLSFQQKLKIFNLSNSTDEITGVHFLDVQRRCHFFIVQKKRVQSFTVFDDSEQFSNLDGFRQDLDESVTFEIQIECSSVFPKARCLLLASLEGVYAFDPLEGNISCLELFGEKLCLASDQDYIHVAYLDERVCRVVSYLLVSNTKLLVSKFETSKILKILPCEGVSFFVSKNFVIRVKPKPTEERLRQLTEKGLYDYATEVCFEAGDLVETCRNLKQHGDYLAEKNQLDPAVEKYCKTVELGHPISTTKVMNVLLKKQDLGGICRYLRKYIDAGYGNSEHVVFYLQSLIHLGQDRVLEAFCKKLAWPKFYLELTEKKTDGYCGKTEITPAFVVEIFVENHVQLAVFVAERMLYHDKFVELVLQIGDFPKCLNYLQKLASSDLREILKNHASELLKRQRLEIIRLLRQHLKNEINSEWLECLQYIFLFDSTSHFFLLLEILESSEYREKCLDISSVTLFEIYFVNEVRCEPERLVKLLTRYESEFSEDTQKKICFLCKKHDFLPGFEFLAAKFGNFIELLNYSFTRDSTAEEILQICEKYGNNEPRLWPRSLRLLMTRNEENLEPVVSRILQVVEEQNLISPVEVFRILERGNLSIGSSSQYFLKILTCERVVVRSSMEDEIENIRSEVKEEDFKIFDVSVCSLCLMHLDHPSINFWCGHSYHTYCSREEFCSLCQPEYEELIRLKESGTSFVHGL